MNRLDLTVQAYVDWIITTCVLAQSVQVATAKLRRGEFRYFVVRDGDGYRLVKTQSPASYLIYDGSRIEAGYQLLQELSLVTRNDGLRILAEGREVMDRVREHHERLSQI
jgi:hypothetical protein